MNVDVWTAGWLSSDMFYKDDTMICHTRMMEWFILHLHVWKSPCNRFLLNVPYKTTNSDISKFTTPVNMKASAVTYQNT
jgi:hypothetical protein